MSWARVVPVDFSQWWCVFYFEHFLSMHVITFWSRLFASNSKSESRFWYSKFDLDRKSKCVSYNNRGKPEYVHVFLQTRWNWNFVLQILILLMTGLASLMQLRNHPIMLAMVNNTLSFYTIWVIEVL